MGRARPTIVIGVGLAVLWLTLSGRSEPLLLALGVISIGIVLVLLARMRILDAEAAGARRIGRLALYWGWLGGEIVKANVAVAKAVLAPKLELSPTLVRVEAGQASDFGRAIYANSITLTPGTVTVDIDEDGFLVHALLESMTDPAGFAAIDGRVTRAAEGQVP